MTMKAEFLEAFTPITWAAPYLNAPDWCARERTRGFPSDDETDRYTRDTIRSYNGVQEWLELYKRPGSFSEPVKKSISLCRYGPGLNGFPGICHGGAIMTLLDEALAFPMVINEMRAKGEDSQEWLPEGWKKLLEEGRPLMEVLAGFMVTAKLEMKFLKPVLCPGVVGIEVDVLEHKEHKMKMRGVMKDSQGMPLVQVDGLWVRIGKGAKL